jgi:imidazolonepropionase-like amidohydrolase
MELHVAAGLSPLETIKIATHNGARILGLDEQIGAIQEGMRADLLVVEGDPSISISDTRNIAFVIQNGVLVDRKVLTKETLGRKQ